MSGLAGGAVLAHPVFIGMDADGNKIGKILQAPALFEDVGKAESGQILPVVDQQKRIMLLFVFLVIGR